MRALIKLRNPGSVMATITHTVLAWASLNIRFDSLVLRYLRIHFCASATCKHQLVSVPHINERRMCQLYVDG